MVRDVPAMPVVAQKVMHMLGDSRTTNVQLGETLASDQSLASRILQMANSPFFGTRKKISSISGAVFVLGHSALRSLIITACTKGLFKNPGLMEEKLWEHSLGSAIAAREIATACNRMDPDEAFISGLLHDIGKPIFVSAYPAEYRAIFTKVYESNLTMEENIALEKEEFGYDHCEVGSRVLTAWRLPTMYARAARRHHTDNLQLISGDDNPEVLAVVAQANRIAMRVGLGRPEPDKRVDVIETNANVYLNLNREKVLQIVEKTLKTYKEARDQFNLT